MTELATLEVVETQDTKPDLIEHCWCGFRNYMVSMCGEKRDTPQPILGHVPDDACVVCLDLHRLNLCPACENPACR